MKIEQLMDSINEINDVYISEVDELRHSGMAKRKPVKVKKMLLIPLVAVLMLLLVGFTAYTFFGGKILLFPGKTGNLTDARVYFERDNSLIESSEIKGSINELSDVIVKQYKEMGKPSDTDFVPVDMHPGHCNVTLKTCEEAEKYISYDGLKIPRMNISGYSEGTSIDILGDENGNIENISVTTEYYAMDSEDFTVQLIETLFTDKQMESEDGTVSIWFSYTDDTDLKQEKMVANGREFLIIRDDLITISDDMIQVPSYESDYVIVNDNVERATKNVFWQENKVIYMFGISYPKSREKEADKLIREWMNSF